MMNCENCGEIVEQAQGKRERRFCSSACRQAEYRRRSYRNAHHIVTDENGNLVTYCVTFTDLPLDVQKSIETMSETRSDGEERIRRAIKYQSVHPDTEIHEDRIHRGSEKPGEAGYPERLYNGTCRACGRATPIKAVNMCFECVGKKYKEAV